MEIERRETENKEKQIREKWRDRKSEKEEHMKDKIGQEKETEGEGAREFRC